MLQLVYAEVRSDHIQETLRRLFMPRSDATNQPSESSSPADFNSWFWSDLPTATAESDPVVAQSESSTDTEPLQQPLSLQPSPSVSPPSLRPDLAADLLAEDAEILGQWDDDDNPPVVDLATWDSSDLADEPLAVTDDPSLDFGIEEIAEDFGSGVELDPELIAQIAEFKQQDYSRKVARLVTRLVEVYQQQGGLTYRDLMAALRVLDRNTDALRQLCTALLQEDVRVKRAPHLYSFNRMDVADQRLIERVFYPILIRHLVPGVALRRMGYEDVALSEDESALLVDALERHQLSRAEEREIFAEIARLGGPASEVARSLVHAVIEDNLWVIVRVARAYLDRGLAFGDLFQEGALGLYRAVQGFNLAAGRRFMIYAGFWVRQAITRAIQDKARLIRLPVHVSETLQDMEQIAQHLEQDLGRSPTDEEVAMAMHVTTRLVTRLRLIAESPVSLENVLPQLESDLAPCIIDRRLEANPEDVALQQALHDDLVKVLVGLEPRQRRIIELRYGLSDYQDRTLEEVGQLMNVTRERVRQIEQGVLKRLQGPRAEAVLGSYIDYPRNRLAAKAVLSPHIPADEKQTGEQSGEVGEADGTATSEDGGTAKAGSAENISGTAKRGRPRKNAPQAKTQESD